MNMMNFKQKILRLAKDKLPTFNVKDVIHSGGESGAYYGSIIFDYNDNEIPYSTGYVFLIPEHLCLTSTLDEIEGRYFSHCYKLKDLPTEVTKLGE